VTVTFESDGHLGYNLLVVLCPTFGGAKILFILFVQQFLKVGYGQLFHHHRR
jgi:hypothetical protein